MEHTMQENSCEHNSMGANYCGKVTHAMAMVAPLVAEYRDARGVAAAKGPRRWRHDVCNQLYNVLAHMECSRWTAQNRRKSGSVA